MRARVFHLWPVLSRTYGLHPDDLPGLSVPELNAYLDDLADDAWG